MAKLTFSRGAKPPVSKTVSVTALLMAALLTGCVNLPSAHPPKPLDPEAHYPLPGAMNEFELPPENDDVIGELQRVRAHPEDTFPDIARRFNVGYEELVAANPGVDPWMPGAGTEVLIPSQWVIPNVPRKGLVINLAAMRLFYFPEPGKNETRRVITHPVGIGRIEWKTPQGKTRVAAKAEAPTWVPTAAIRREHELEGDPLPASVPPGPDNPMGEYVLRLGWPEYAIHGTNKPASIGMRGTHGCLRMYPEDIAVLFEKVPVNTPVTVINEPYLIGFHDDKLYLQAYPVLEDDKRDHSPRVKALIKKARTEHARKTGEKDKLVINDTLVQALSNRPRALTLPVSVPENSVELLLSRTAISVKNRLPLAANWNGEGDVTMTSLAAHPAKADEAPASTGPLANNAVVSREPSPLATPTEVIHEQPPAASAAVPAVSADTAPEFKSGVVSDL